jgi:integrase/recombinase XerD
VTAYTHTARLLGWLAEVPQVAAPDGLARMSPPLVAQSLLARAGQVQAWAMKATAGRLRAFLRYLYAAGLIPHPLDGAVPPPAGWGLTALAKAVPEEKIAAVLAACDRATARGRRDYAIVLILRRLGLRNGEVARLDLDDIDWRAGVMRHFLFGRGRSSERYAGGSSRTTAAPSNYYAETDRQGRSVSLLRGRHGVR